MLASRTFTTVSFAQRVTAGILAMSFGALLLYGVGFAQDSRLHNAAHDTRHAIGFPCH
jgi:cobalt transporter subunit CbtB